MAGSKIGFDMWKRRVDKEVEKRVGLSADDLPDIDYYRMYEAGESPSKAAMAAIKNAQES